MSTRHNTDAFRSRASLLRRSKAFGCEGWMGVRCPWLNAGRLFAMLVGLLWFGLLMGRAQDTHYVATNGPGPSPYTSWATAASNIQDAIGQATAGDTVLVSNGVYAVGGITNYPSGTVLTNRVAIWKAITVRSADNNPTNTVIKGEWNPTDTNGPAAVRCVYMTNGATLIGFTLTNGATLVAGAANNLSGGGVWSQSTNTVISNCVLTGNSAYYYGGGAYYGTLFNCTLIGNSTTWGGAPYGGGGAYASTMFNCSIVSNYSALYAGGTHSAKLFGCTLIGNYAANQGGGAMYGTLSNCTLIGNSSPGTGAGVNLATVYNCMIISNSSTGVTISGGGASGSTLYNCTLSYNRCTGSGGGANGGTLYNCLLIGNLASQYGGGARNAVLLSNCTIVGNRADLGYGGVSAGTLSNCISWGNNYVDGGALNYYSCGAGYTNGGSVFGNITNNPLFITNGTGYGTNHLAGNYRLRKESPAINAGTNQSWMTDPAVVHSKDLDGLRRIDRFSGQVDMGAYEYLPAGTMFTGR